MRYGCKTILLLPPEDLRDFSGLAGGVIKPSENKAKRLSDHRREQRQATYTLQQLGELGEGGRCPCTVFEGHDGLIHQEHEAKGGVGECTYRARLVRGYIGGVRQCDPEVWRADLRKGCIDRKMRGKGGRGWSFRRGDWCSGVS